MLFKKLTIWIGLLVVVGPLFAQSVSSTPSPAPTIGVVLLHGKQGHTQFDTSLVRVNSALQSAGMIVVRPEMAWSYKRLMDKDWSDAVDEIKEHIQTLKLRGAQRIVLTARFRWKNSQPHGDDRHSANGYPAQTPIARVGSRVPVRVGSYTM